MSADVTMSNRGLLRNYRTTPRHILEVIDRYQIIDRLYFMFHLCAHLSAKQNKILYNNLSKVDHKSCLTVLQK